MRPYVPLISCQVVLKLCASEMSIINAHQNAWLHKQSGWMSVRFNVGILVLNNFRKLQNYLCNILKFASKNIVVQHRELDDTHWYIIIIFILFLLCSAQGLRNDFKDALDKIDADYLTQLAKQEVSQTVSE